MLLKAGANPNEMYGEESILSISICWGTPETTALLIRNGADPNLATKNCYHPLLKIFYDRTFEKKQLKNLAILLRAGSNPLIELKYDIGNNEYSKTTIFGFMKENYYAIKKLDSKIFRSIGDESYSTLYKKAGRAVVRYKILWSHLRKNWCLPEDITERILTFVDFGLDDYHVRKVRCAICYEKTLFTAIPCSNTHTDSICSTCISTITDCPLCRTKLKK